jgi:hypothetical protein
VFIVDFNVGCAVGHITSFLAALVPVHAPLYVGVAGAAPLHRGPCRSAPHARYISGGTSCIGASALHPHDEGRSGVQFDFLPEA